jgi:hypothetical protein
MATTNKSIELWIERESRITRMMIEDGKAEEAGMYARILFQTTAKRYRIRAPKVPSEWEQLCAQLAMSPLDTRQYIGMVEDSGRIVSVPVDSL